MSAEDLEFTDIQVRDVGRLDAEVLYETDAPLADIQIAGNGSMVCMKIAGKIAELLYFDSFYSKPDVWVTSDKLRLAHLFAFDGDHAYANTEHSLLMVDPGAIRDVYGSRGPVFFPSMSPNGRSVVWVEGCSHSKGFVVETLESSKVHSIPLSDCCRAIWLGTGEIVAFEIRTTRGNEEECSLSLHSPNGSLIRELLTTDMGIAKLTGDPHDRVLVVAASRRNWGSGIWLIALNDGIQILNIAHGQPIGAMIFSGGQCFFGENLPAPAPYTLICASKHFTRRATVSDPMIDFAVDSAREWLVYRTYGATGSLKRISLAAFAPTENGHREMS
jgi:hypothetical protein